MLYNLANPADREQLRQYADYLTQKQAIAELKECKPRRTLSQNAYLHFVLRYYASEFGYSMEEVKFSVFKQTVNKDIFGRERQNRRGQCIVYFRSTRDLDTAEMTTAIARFRNYASAVAGLYIPEPHEQDAYVEALRQISAYEQFL